MMHLAVFAFVIGAILIALWVVKKGPWPILITGLLLFVVGALLPAFTSVEQTEKDVQIRKFVKDMFNAPHASCLMGRDGRAYRLQGVHAQDQNRLWISRHHKSLLEPFSRRHPGQNEAWWQSYIVIIIKPGDEGWMRCVDIYWGQTY